MESFDRALLHALSMIKWPGPVKYRLVAYVRGNEQHSPVGTELSQQATHETTAIQRLMIHKHYRELVDARVLERFEGGGPRGHAYRVNPRFEEWIVPWRRARADSLLDREVALGMIDRILRPPVDPNARTVARPDARLTLTASRALARLSAAARADGRASDEPLAARPFARPETANGAPTQFPLIEDLSHSLDPAPRASEGGSRLRAAIRERSGEEVWGRLAAEIFALGCDAEVDRAIDRVRNAKPGLSITAYIEIAEGALLEPESPPVAAPKMWEPPPAEPSAPPPWIDAGLTHQEWLTSCENAGGGAQ